MRKFSFCQTVSDSRVKKYHNTKRAVDNVDEDEYSDERCDGDVEEAITWLRQHHCYIRVLLDRCLLADLCDDYCVQLTELPNE